MNLARFDPDEIMNAVRAATPATPATVPQFKHPSVAAVATVAATPCAQRLREHPCPEGFTPARWACLQDGAAGFAEQWADKAISLGWTYEELFGLKEPFGNLSLQGAAWFIGDATITAVTADAITLRTASGATLRSYRKRESGDKELNAAITFLEAELADCAWRNSFDLEAKADAGGINREDLARARHKLGVESRQWPGAPRRWRLPNAEASQ
jgi:hypothetical protein